MNEVKELQYKNYLSKITEALVEYKKEIDTLAEQYAAEKERIKQKAQSMKSQWTEQYIEKYILENQPNTAYQNKMKDAREKVKPTVTHYLEMIEKSLDSYFNAPVNATFANKIMSISVTGLQLSNLEFQILKNSATTYMEFRLLNQLAETRTKKGTVIELDKNGTPRSKEVDLKAPYLYLELPNIEETYKKFAELKTSANMLLNSYSGKNAEMAHLLDNSVSKYAILAADAFFRCGYEEKFVDAMEKANSILPDSKIKRELTENDKKLIDLLIDSKYPSLAHSRAKELAAESPDIRNLLVLDPRYKEAVLSEE